MAATHTTNFGLNKPDRQDFISVVTDINDNMDMIDTAIGSPSSASGVTGSDVYAKIGTLDSEKIDTSDIVDNLTTNDPSKPLSAAQGYTLNDNKVDISAIKNDLTTTSSGYVLDARQGKALNDNIANILQNFNVELITSDQQSTTGLLYGRIYLVALTGSTASGSIGSVYLFFPGYSTSKLFAITEGSNKATVDSTNKNKLNYTWGTTGNGGAILRLV